MEQIEIKKPIYITFFLLLIIVVLLMLIYIFSFPSKTHEINDGILDLKQWDIAEGKNIKLDGVWKFYWNKLLYYGEEALLEPDLYAKIPSVWNHYKLDGENLSGKGYATYRLHVQTNLPENELLALRIFTFSSAYQLYINEKLVAQSGRVGTNGSLEIGEYKPQKVVFATPAQEFDIIIHVSNHQYGKGGFWYSIHMGMPENIGRLHDKIMGKQLFIMGTLLIVALFYLIIFILRRELIYSLYFSLHCISMIFLLDLVGQCIIPRLLGGISFNIVIFIWYSSILWTIFFLFCFIHTLFPTRHSKTIVKVFLFLFTIIQIIYIFTPTYFYTRFGKIGNYFEIFAVISMVIITGIGVKEKKQGALLNMASMIIVLITYIHDAFYWTNDIEHAIGEIFFIGIFLFIFIQMFIQAQRIKLFHEKKIAAELAFLQAQIKPHFLYNALNTFISISRYDAEKARNLLIDFSRYLRGSFDFKDLSQFVTLKNEIELAKAYVEIERARFEERLEVCFEIPEELEVKVPILILQPLIENAILHGILPKIEGGSVNIVIEKKNRSLEFKIQDNGVGMDLSKPTDQLKEDGDRGIGISNIDHRLRKLYGRGLEIKSVLGEGTTISWEIRL